MLGRLFYIAVFARNSIENRSLAIHFLTLNKFFVSLLLFMVYASPLTSSTPYSGSVLILWVCIVATWIMLFLLAPELPLLIPLFLRYQLGILYLPLFQFMWMMV